jgi:hypothetical protein
VGAECGCRVKMGERESEERGRCGKQMENNKILNSL